MWMRRKRAMQPGVSSPWRRLSPQQLRLDIFGLGLFHEPRGPLTEHRLAITEGLGVSR